MPKPPRRPADPDAPGESRRDRLIRAALVVLARDGWAGLTARKVAAEAGMSLGHITYNFASMDALLSEAYRRLAEDLRRASDAADEAAGNDAAGRLAAFLDAPFAADFLTPGHLRMRIDLWSAAQAHPAIAATEAELYGRYRDRLMAHLAELARGHGTEARLAAVADTIMAAQDGLWLDWARRRDGEAVRRGLALLNELARLTLAPPDCDGQGGGGQGGGGQESGSDPARP